MKNIKHQIVYITIIYSLFMLGCAKEKPIEFSITKKGVYGVVQKGPFINGSKITVMELDNDFNQTGKTFITTIKNDKGEFDLPELYLVSKYIELNADGYFFNELSGQISTSSINFSAISNIEEQSSVNINILTHLETKRVLKLAKQGMPFTLAKEKALSEILQTFYINDTIDKSENINITEQNTKSNILIAISSILLNNKSEGQLIEFLSKLSFDYEDNGVIDNDDLKKEIINSSKNLCIWHVDENHVKPYRKIDIIRNNLVNRYKELKQEVNIGKFEYYLDNNENGDLSDFPKYDFSTLSFGSISDVTNVDSLYFSNEIVLRGIPDSVICWFPSYKLGANSVKDSFYYFTGGGTIGDHEYLINKYGYLKGYKNGLYDYLTNGLLIHLRDKYEDTFYPTYHIFINGTPLDPHEAENRVYYLRNNDRIQLAMNPYHRLYDYTTTMSPPYKGADIPLNLLQGQIARAAVFIEGQSVAFSISIKN